MEYVDKAIEHTPTMMELCMIKAKVYKVFCLFLYLMCLVKYYEKYPSVRFSSIIQYGRTLIGIMHLLTKT